MIAHGVSRFLKERLFECSDPFIVDICNVCGMIATSPTECKGCDTDKVSRVSIPFASKLLLQTLMAMQIKCQMTIKE